MGVFTNVDARKISNEVSNEVLKQEKEKQKLITGIIEKARKNLPNLIPKFIEHNVIPEIKLAAGKGKNSIRFDNKASGIADACANIHDNFFNPVKKKVEKHGGGGCDGIINYRDYLIREIPIIVRECLEKDGFTVDDCSVYKNNNNFIHLILVVSW